MSEAFTKHLIASQLKLSVSAKLCHLDMFELEGATWVNILWPKKFTQNFARQILEGDLKAV